jgi:hypothetical protein
MDTRCDKTLSLFMMTVKQLGMLTDSALEGIDPLLYPPGPAQFSRWWI